MLSRQDVAADVGLTMRNVIVRWTPFTLLDPDADQSGFRFTLIPSEDLWNGWRADQRSWHNSLSMILQALHSLRPEYGTANITVGDVIATLDEPLSATRTLLIDKIMTGISEVSGPDTE